MNGDRDRKENSIGIPRALLYYRYAVLWDVFFHELGFEVKTSGVTTRKILEEGEALAIDEACLSGKIFLGHVNALIGKCDYILVPRIAGFGLRRNMCTKFEALYDLTVNTFRGSNQKFLGYNVDYEKGIDEQKAFTELGVSLGFSGKEARKAYKRAAKAQNEDFQKKARMQEERYKSEKLKILLAGHSYVIEDEYIGKPVTDILKNLGTEVIRADLENRKAALEQGAAFSPTLKWEVNREIAGSIRMNQKKVDGIILVSAFPCGPDSMANEMIQRKITGIPVLNLILDGQSGIAGVETRLESFVDIIRFKRGQKS